MLIIGTKEQIQQYREHPGMNQSTLKNVQNGLSYFLKKQDEEGPIASFERGSAVDTILTGNEGDFKDLYYISALEKKPSDKEMEIVELIFNKLSSVYEDSITQFGLDSPMIKGTVQQSIEETGWQPNWKIETRIEKITGNPLCQEYFDDLKKSIGKTILSQAQMEQINATVESLRTNEYTKDFFDRKSIMENDRVIVLYQVPIYFSIDGIECKALPDIVTLFLDKVEIENEDGTKEVQTTLKGIQLIDLKTTSKDTLEFFDAVMSYRYEIQAAWYIEAVQRVNEKFWNDLGLVLSKDTPTEILPFAFIVESITEPGKPLIYHMNESLIAQGKEGTQDIYYQDRLVKKGKRGFLSLMAELKYYQDNEFTEDIILQGKEGNLILGINGIV